MQVVFTEAARRELTEATAWFQDHSELGAAGFAIAHTSRRPGYWLPRLP